MRYDIRYNFTKNSVTSHTIFKPSNEYGWWWWNTIISIPINHLLNHPLMHLKNLEKYTFSFSSFNFGYASLCADWVISGYQIQSDTFSKRDIWDKCEIYWVYSMFHYGLQWPLLMYSHSNWKKRQMLPDIPKWCSFCSSILK